MSHSRSTVERRRRVLYHSQQCETEPTGAASRRAQERLREARKPTAAYGSRVNRRLRGRWFSLVPVRRAALMTFTSIVIGFSVLLAGCHFAVMTWPAFATPDYLPVARPLRLDSPESIGRWWTSMVLMLAAGTSLMIYQLRRHRNDDYLGHYRIWRMVLVVSLLASVNSIAGVIDWMGAVMDLMVGRRVALSGSDWSRIVLTVAGVIFALRLTVEVRRSRWAVIWMSAGWICLALPAAVMWNILPIRSVQAFAIITSTPLLGYACLWMALVGYLRLLFREVRKMDDSMIDMLAMQNAASKLRPRMPAWLNRSHNGEADIEKTDAVRKTAPPQPSEAQPKQRRTAASKASIERESSKTTSSATAGKDDPGQPRRSWWSKLRPQPKQVGDRVNPAKSSGTKRPPESKVADRSLASASPERSDDERNEKASKRRSWFSFRLQPKRNDESDESNANGESKASQPETKPVAARKKSPQPEANSAAKSEKDPTDAGDRPKRGLGSFFRRKPKAAVVDADKPDGDDAVQSRDRTTTAAANPVSGKNESSVSNENVVMDPNDEGFDESKIDWASLSKAERRRLRKLMKRQNRAA